MLNVLLRLFTRQGAFHLLDHKAINFLTLKLSLSLFKRGILIMLQYIFLNFVEIKLLSAALLNNRCF